MTIQAILGGRSGEVISISKDASVTDAIALLADRRIGALPVVDGDTVLGIFSERDVIYGLRKEGGTALDRPVGAVMTAPAITVEPDAPVLSALSLMTRRRIRHLPVVSDARLVGFVSIGDLVKYRIDKIEAEAAAMRDYILMS